MSKGGLFGRSGIYALGSVVQMLASVLVVPVLTRLLPATEFGLSVSGLIAVQLTWILASVGIPAAITRQYFMARGPEQARRLVSLAAGLAAVLTILLEATAGLWASALGFPEATAGLRWAILAGGLLAVVNACQSLQRVQGAAPVFVMSVAISALGGNLGGLALCTMAAHPTHTSYLVGLAFGNAAALLFGILRARPLMPGRADLESLRRIGLPTVPHMFGIYLISSQDRLVVAATLGAGGVARYQVAYFVGSVTMLGLQAVNNAWAPMILGAPDEDRDALLRHTTRQIAWLCALGITASVVLAPVGLAIVAPASYDVGDLTQTVAVLALGAVPALIYLSHSHLLYVTGRMGAFVYSAPIAAAGGALTSYLLSGPWGLLGVAVGAVTAQTLLAVLVSHRSRHHRTVPGLLGQVVVPAAVGAGVVAASWLW